MRRHADALADDALAIYLLHGVVPEPTTGVRNATTKHLDAARFRALCEALLAAGTPLGADAAIAALRGEAELPPRAFLLSFDDGFANNLEVAAPIMRELGVHAVFYVTTGFVGTAEGSWTDQVEDAVARTTVGELTLPWEDAPRPVRSLDERLALVAEVRRVVKTTPAIDPHAAAAEVCARAAAGPFAADPFLDRKLTWDEVRALHADPLFTVGGHSHTHPILSFLSPADLAFELDTSLGLLSRELGGPVRHYSYPEGLAHCYSDEVIDALRARGVECCPTAEEGVNLVGDDLFRLRRIWVL